MTEITDINDPRISLYKSLKGTPKTHTDNKLFITEGEKVTEKLLNSPLEILSVFFLDKYSAQLMPLIKSKSIPENNIYTASKTLMNDIVGFKLHEGIMAIAKEPSEYPLESMDNRIVILNGIVNSENVGAIVRNCAAFSVNSLVVDKSTSSPYMRRAVRVSMGHVFDLKINRPDSPEEAILTLKKYGYRIISAEKNDQSISIHELEPPSKFAIIFGSEGRGIDKNILNLSDDIIHIPINPEVSSINVAAASAVVMNEIKSKI